MSGGGTTLKVDAFEFRDSVAYSKYELFTDVASNFKKVYEFTEGVTYAFRVAHTNATATSGNYTVMVIDDDDCSGYTAISLYGKYRQKTAAYP